jgi:hypothetical protein
MYSPAAQSQRSHGATSRYASPTRSSAVKSGDAHERFQTVQRFTTLVRRAKDIAHSATVSRDVHGYSAFRRSTYQSTPPIAGGNSALRGNTSDFVSLSRDPRDPRLLFAPLREAMNEPLVPRAHRPRRAQSVPPSVSAAWTALNDSVHVPTSTRGTSPSMASRYGDPGAAEMPEVVRLALLTSTLLRTLALGGHMPALIDTPTPRLPRPMVAEAQDARLKEELAMDILRRLDRDGGTNGDHGVVKRPVYLLSPPRASESATPSAVTDRRTTPDGSPPLQREQRGDSAPSAAASPPPPHQPAIVSSRVPQTPEPPSPPRKSATPEPPAPSIEKLSADASPTAASEEKESDVAHSPLRGGTPAPPNAPPVADSPAVRLQRIREQRAAREASAGRHEDAGHDPSTPPPRAVSSTPPPPPQEPSGPAPMVAESPAERLRRIREHRGAVSSAAHTQDTNGLAAAPSGAIASAPSDAALTETPAERMRRLRAARAAEGAHAETESVAAEAATVAPERFSFTPSALMASRSEPAPANVTAPPPAQDSVADAAKTADAEPAQPKTSTAARAKLEALRAARTASGYL